MRNLPIDRLRLHPHSEMVPMAEPSDLAVLRASLAEHGQQDPIDITPDGLILDGRTRWTLLRDLGATSIQVREVAIPEGDQTNYIVDRALARRHLTNEQKRALNGLLRATVIEVVEHPRTGEEMRIGLSRPARAAKLGVDEDTVRRWDKEPPVNKGGSQAGPTHIRRGGANPSILPAHPKPSVKPTPNGKPLPLRKDRAIPAWSRHFSTWCRRSRPEDREFLLRMAREIHAALRQNDIEYEED